ncbi:hypothetical protein [Nocardioides cynanchi]|uniref:hypothetical protein n=1 Tax=Nocardioides cynanchi TaxID=2558918 RepID=UPI001EE1D930|nr:hypothetical protein [Nocardioides cynanchi]
MPVLDEPLPREMTRLLRRAVLDLAVSDHRMHVPPVLHLGLPGGPAVAVADDPGWDHGLRTDIVATLLAAVPEPAALTWLTRSGPVSLHDADAAWLAPVLAAHAEQRREPTFVVVTRHGWTDPRSGAGRRWKRIRQR